MNKFTYIASPYSGTAKEMKERFDAVEEYTATIMKVDSIVFSPIVHCHALAANHNMPTDFKFWQNYCIGMLESAGDLVVFKIKGWENSKGVSAEVLRAKEMGIQVSYVNAKTYVVEE